VERVLRCSLRFMRSRTRLFLFPLCAVSDPPRERSQALVFWLDRLGSQTGYICVSE
jgi:hypothetical protein